MSHATFHMHIGLAHLITNRILLHLAEQLRQPLGMPLHDAAPRALFGIMSPSRRHAALDSLYAETPASVGFLLGTPIPFGRIVASRLYFAIWVLSWAYPLRSAIWEALERPARPASVDIGYITSLARRGRCHHVTVGPFHFACMFCSRQGWACLGTSFHTTVLWILLLGTFHTLWQLRCWAVCVCVCVIGICSSYGLQRPWHAASRVER
jgi:hypothetical protein